MKRMKKATERHEEELQELRTFKEEVSAVVTGMDIPQLQRS
jgi:hypothetical protein